MSGRGRSIQSVQSVHSVNGMGSVTKKDHVQKHIRRSLVRSPDRSVIPLWSRRLHIVMEPLAVTAGGVGSQAWYFVGDAAGGPLVCAVGVGGAV